MCGKTHMVRAPIFQQKISFLRRDKPDLRCSHNLKKNRFVTFLGGGGSLRYHGTWIFTVQIQKTKTNVVQKEWGRKHFLLFKIKRKTIFESYYFLTVRCTPNYNSPPVVRLMRISVWFFICASELAANWLFHHKLAFFKSGRKCKGISCPFSPVFAKIWRNP